MSKEENLLTCYLLWKGYKWIGIDIINEYKKLKDKYSYVRERILKAYLLENYSEVEKVFKERTGYSFIPKVFIDDSLLDWLFVRLGLKKERIIDGKVKRRIHLALSRFTYGGDDTYSFAIGEIYLKLYHFLTFEFCRLLEDIKSDAGFLLENTDLGLGPILDLIDEDISEKIGLFKEILEKESIKLKIGAKKKFEGREIVFTQKKESGLLFLKETLSLLERFIDGKLRREVITIDDLIKEILKLSISIYPYQCGKIIYKGKKIKIRVDKFALAYSILGLIDLHFRWKGKDIEIEAKEKDEEVFLDIIVPPENKKLYQKLNFVEDEFVDLDVAYEKGLYSWLFFEEILATMKAKLKIIKKKNKFIVRIIFKDIFKVNVSSSLKKKITDRDTLRKISHLFGLGHCKNEGMRKGLLNVFRNTEFSSICSRESDKKSSSPLSKKEVIRQIKGLIKDNDIYIVQVRKVVSSCLQSIYETFEDSFIRERLEREGIIILERLSEGENASVYLAQYFSYEKVVAKVLPYEVGIHYGVEERFKIAQYFYKKLGKHSYFPRPFKLISLEGGKVVLIEEMIEGKSRGEMEELLSSAELQFLEVYSLVDIWLESFSLEGFEGLVIRDVTPSDLRFVKIEGKWRIKFLDLEERNYFPKLEDMIKFYSLEEYDYPPDLLYKALKILERKKRNSKKYKTSSSLNKICPSSSFALSIEDELLERFFDNEMVWIENFYGEPKQIGIKPAKSIRILKWFWVDVYIRPERWITRIKLKEPFFDDSVVVLWEEAFGFNLPHLINGIGIGEQYQKRGIATCLYHFLDKLTQRRGKRWLVTTYPFNPKILSIYKKIFKEIEIKPLNPFLSSLISFIWKNLFEIDSICKLEYSRQWIPIDALDLGTLKSTSLLLAKAIRGSNQTSSSLCKTIISPLKVIYNLIKPKRAPPFLGLKHCGNEYTMKGLLNVFGYIGFCPFCQKKLNKRSASPLSKEEALNQIKELDIDKKAKEVLEWFITDNIEKSELRFYSLLISMQDVVRFSEKITPSKFLSQISQAFFEISFLKKWLKVGMVSQEGYYEIFSPFINALYYASSDDFIRILDEALLLYREEKKVKLPYIEEYKPIYNLDSLCGGILLVRDREMLRGMLRGLSQQSFSLLADELSIFYEKVGVLPWYQEGWELIREIVSSLKTNDYSLVPQFSGSVDEENTDEENIFLDNLEKIRTNNLEVKIAIQHIEERLKERNFYSAQFELEKLLKRIGNKELSVSEEESKKILTLKEWCCDVLSKTEKILRIYKRGFKYDPYTLCIKDKRSEIDFQDISYKNIVLSRYIFYKVYYLGMMLMYLIEDFKEKYDKELLNGILYSYIIHFLKKIKFNHLQKKLLEQMEIEGVTSQDMEEVLKEKNFRKCLSLLREKTGYSKDKEIESRIIETWQKLDLEDRERKLIDLYSRQKRRLRIERLPNVKLIEKERKSLIEKFGKLLPHFVSKVFLKELVILPTKRCSRRCPHCYVLKNSTEKKESWKSDLKEILKIAEKEGIGDICISGGEPLEFALEDTLSILREIPSSFNIILTTNCFWAKDISSTRKILRKIWKVVKKRKVQNYKLTLQISCDSFHQKVFVNQKGKIYENIPVRNIANVIQVITDLGIGVKEHPGIGVNILICMDNLSNKFFTIFEEVEVELQKRGYSFSIVPSDGLALSGDLYNKLKEALDNLQCEKLVVNVLSSKYQYINIIKHLVIPQGKALLLAPFEIYLSESYLERNIKKIIEGKKPYRNVALVWYFDIEKRRIFTLDSAVCVSVFSAGNLEEESAEKIVEFLKKDILLYAIHSYLGLVYGLAKEANPHIERIAKRLFNLRTIAFLLIESPSLRLYLTKRLIQQYINEMSQLQLNRLGFKISKEEALRELGLNVSKEDLIKEYNENLKEEGGYFSIFDISYEGYNPWQGIITKWYPQNTSSPIRLTNKITPSFTFPHRLDKVYRYIERFSFAFFGLDLSKGKKLIVDVGMGGRGAPTTFDMYRILSKLNPDLKITGIDYNPDNVKLAQEKAQKEGIKNISFIKSGFNFHLGKNGKADVITCFNVLMDYERDERLAAIKELGRRLKNKGVLLEGRSDDIGKYISFIIYQLENEVLIRKQIIFCVNLKSLTNPQLFRRILPAEFIGDELNWGISSFIEEWEYSNYRFMYLNNPKQILKSVAEELRKKNYNVIPDSKLLKRGYVVLKYKRNGKASSTLRQQKREILPQSVIDKLIQVYFKQRSPQNKKCVDGFCCFIKNEKSFPVKLVSFFSADLDEVLSENLISSAKQDYPCDKLGIFFDYKDNKLYILTKCTDYHKRPHRCRKYPGSRIFSYECCEYQSFLEGRREYLYILFEDALRNNPIVNASEEIKEGGIYFTKEAFRFLKEVFKEESINAGGVNFSSFVILLPERRKEVSFYGGINRKNTLKNTIRGSSSPVYFGRKPLKDEDIPSLLSRCFKRVEEERNKAGINISELCRKSGVSLSTYEFIRLGRRRPGNPVFILNLLKYFGLEKRLSPQERELLNEALRMGTKGVRKLLRDEDRIIPKRIWKEVIRRLKEIGGKELKEVSKKLNIPPHTLRSWKKGESQPLHPIYIKKILQYFNLLNELSQEERQRLNRKIREIDKTSYYQQGKNSLRKIAKEIGSSHQTVKDIIVRIKERERKILKGVDLGILTVEVKREGEVS
ncbi:MAG TPA: methyltransferase domain-containing protein, partial [Candidatus Omnitrophica bacterium]|nr:methyltransferase domain-containing protein [Candidatus Omnitrophota bacterium]